MIPEQQKSIDLPRPVHVLHLLNDLGDNSSLLLNLGFNFKSPPFLILRNCLALQHKGLRMKLVSISNFYERRQMFVIQIPYELHP